MKLKDVLHFYTGQKTLTPFGILTLSSVNQKSRYKAWFTEDYEENKSILNSNGLTGKSFYLTELQLLLRPLISMTEEEQWEYVGGKSNLYDDVRISKFDEKGIVIDYTIDAGDEGRYP